MAGKYDKKKPRKARPASADKTRRAAAVAKARSKPSAPSAVVKAYVDRKIDAAVPDQTLNYRYSGQLPIGGTSFMSPIFRIDGVLSGQDYPVAPAFTVAPWTDMINMSMTKLYTARNGFPFSSDLSNLFPRLRVKLKGIRVSGQVSIPALAGQTGTGWAHVKIIAFEDRSYDPHQDGVSEANIKAPNTNILMDRRLVSEKQTWDSADCSFAPTGGYLQESASFNTNGFRMLGVANIGLYNSVMNPQHNLKKFAFNIKCPSYLNYRQKDSDRQLAQKSPVPSNFFPCIAAYAVYEDGSTAPVDLQLDTAIRVEPVAN